jgi:hypothetical protein
MEEKLNLANDFDFEIGDWAVKHVKQKDILNRSKELIEFDGISSTKKILGGLGNIEENHLNIPNCSFHAIALRSFNPKTKLWSIWWLDGRFPDNLDVPVVGSFKNGIGLFYADILVNNKPVKVRFTWNTQNHKNPKWDQAFSYDLGKNWEINWTMSFFPR